MTNDTSARDWLTVGATAHIIEWNLLDHLDKGSTEVDEAVRS